MNFKWRTPNNKEIAKQWRLDLKASLSSEEEQFPQWCQALGVELPEYANLKLPLSAQFGIHHQNKKTNFVLTLFENKKLVGFLSLTRQLNSKEQYITLSDVYIKPEYRKTKASDMMIEKIIEIIKDENVECTVLSTLLASISGVKFHSKLKTILDNINIKTIYNTNIDPTYNH